MPTAGPRRSKHLMKCMPELPEDQLDAGQVVRGGTNVQDHSPTRGRPTSADGAVDAWLSTEVSAMNQLPTDSTSQRPTSPTARVTPMVVCRLATHPYKRRTTSTQTGCDEITPCSRSARVRYQYTM